MFFILINIKAANDLSQIHGQPTLSWTQQPHWRDTEFLHNIRASHQEALAKNNAQPFLKVWRPCRRVMILHFSALAYMCLGAYFIRHNVSAKRFIAGPRLAQQD